MGSGYIFGDLDGTTSADVSGSSSREELVEPAGSFAGLISWPTQWDLWQSPRIAPICSALAMAIFFVLAIALIGTVVSRHQIAAERRTSEAGVRPVERKQASRLSRKATAPTIPASTRFVCMYQQPNNGSQGLDLRRFPHSYCHYITYCCLSVRPSPRDGAALRTVAQLSVAKGGMPYAVSVVLGGSVSEDKHLSALLHNADKVEQLVTRVARANAGSDGALFSRVYLYWKRPLERHRDALTRLVADLKERLEPLTLRLSLVVDGSRDVASSFDFPRLLDVLGDRGLLVAPQSFPPEPPGRDHAYHGAETLALHARIGFFSEEHSDRVCHALSLAAVALNGSRGGAPLVRPYGDVCSLKFASTQRHGLATVGVTPGGDAVSFLEPSWARAFTALLCQRARTDCVVFWNPEYDDHEGKCRRHTFPLIKAIVGMPVP